MHLPAIISSLVSSAFLITRAPSGVTPTALPSIIREGVMTLTSLPMVSERASQSLRICEKGLGLEIYILLLKLGEKILKKRNSFYMSSQAQLSKLWSPHEKTREYLLSPYSH